MSDFQRLQVWGNWEVSVGWVYSFFLTEEKVLELRVVIAVQPYEYTIVE